jgi:hypothetical protein
VKEVEPELCFREVTLGEVGIANDKVEAAAFDQGVQLSLVTTSLVTTACSNNVVAAPVRGTCLRASAQKASAFARSKAPRGSASQWNRTR